MRLRGSGRAGAACVADGACSPARHDRNVHVWDWHRQVRVGTGKVSQQMCAVAISSDGKRMVTCGVRHVKFWSLESLGTDRVRREAGYFPP